MPISRASLIIAGRYLISTGSGGSFRRIRGAILSVALSLIPLIVVMEVSDGMIEGITARYLELGTYHMQAISGRDSELQDSQALKACEASGVKLAVRERQGVALAYSRLGRGGVTLRAVPPDLWQRDAGLRAYMEIRSGSFDLSTQDSAVVGAEIAARLGLKTGDEIKILTTRSLSADNLMPRVSTFIVRGIVSTGYQEMDKLWIYIPIERGDRIMSRETSRQIIGIKVEKPFASLAGISKELRAAFPFPSFRIYSWNELEYAQYVSFATTRYLLMFIMALIICVAAVNIFSSLVMIQIEKREEIAILKSLGMPGSGVFGVFIIMGLVVGCVGTFCGVAAGLAISVSINEIISFVELCINGAWDFARRLLFMGGGERIRIFNPDFYLERIPITIKMGELVIAAGFSLFVALVAAWLPSRGAGKIRPLEILRKH